MIALRHLPTLLNVDVDVDATRIYGFTATKAPSRPRVRKFAGYAGDLRYRIKSEYDKLEFFLSCIKHYFVLPALTKKTLAYLDCAI